MTITLYRTVYLLELHEFAIKPTTNLNAGKHSKQATRENCCLNALQWLKLPRPFNAPFQCRDVTVYAKQSFMGVLKVFVPFLMCIKELYNL